MVLQAFYFLLQRHLLVVGRVIVKSFKDTPTSASPQRIVLFWMDGMEQVSIKVSLAGQVH
jgi:hypothetical protein